jgi:large subunit ribosomal protein L3
MAKQILGKKVGMTQIFDEAGGRVPVTVIEAGPCTILGTQTPEKNKYSALKVAFDEFPKPAEGKKSRAEKVLSKAELGVFLKAGQAPARVVREFRVDAKELEGVKPGDQIKVDIFAKGDLIDVSGITKGHGFAGVMFRHNMAGMGAPQSHGAHEYHRHQGAIGQRKTPGRTYKGKRMPGHMGVVKCTVQNLTVAGVDAENNLLLIKGAVPGANGAIITIRSAVKTKKAKQG